MWAMIGTILKFAWAIFQMISEKNAEKKKQMQEGLKEVIDGIEKGDDSAITAGFNHINRSG